MQADAEAQATVFRKVNCAPAGLAVGWMLQRVPFHRSARLPTLEFPTAVHADEDRHVTPLRNAPPCGGLGAARVVQVVPFHRSASVPAAEPPTAVQAEGDVHATPARKAPAGLGAAGPASCCRPTARPAPCQACRGLTRRPRCTPSARCTTRRPGSLTQSSGWAGSATWCRSTAPLAPATRVTG